MLKAMMSALLLSVVVIGMSSRRANAEAYDSRNSSSEVQDASDGGEATARWWETGGGEDEGDGSTNGGGGSGGEASEPVEICVQSTVDAVIARQLTGRTDMPDGSQWVVTTCDLAPGVPGANEIRDVQPVGVAAAPSPYVLLEEAKQRLHLPLPTPDLSPSTEVAHLVGIPEWLAIDPEGFDTHDATAAVASLSVTLTATPQRTVWDLGNGDTVTCDGGGTRWQPGGDAAIVPSCGYVYQVSSTARPDGVYHAAVTTIWSRQWGCTPACAGGVLPDLARTTPFDLTVHQGQAIITRTGA
jgi:hypothetical protein